MEGVIPTRSSEQAAPYGVAHLRPTTLRDVINDCGGAKAVAKTMQRALPTIYTWCALGRVPDSDLKTGKGRTTYADTLAAMQRTGTLSAAQIRLLGRQL